MQRETSLARPPEAEDHTITALPLSWPSRDPAGLLPPFCSLEVPAASIRSPEWCLARTMVSTALHGMVTMEARSLDLRLHQQLASPLCVYGRRPSCTSSRNRAAMDEARLTGT